MTIYISMYVHINTIYSDEPVTERTTLASNVPPAHCHQQMRSDEYFLQAELIKSRSNHCFANGIHFIIYGCGEEMSFFGLIIKISLLFRSLTRLSYFLQNILDVGNGTMNYQMYIRTYLQVFIRIK